MKIVEGYLTLEKAADILKNMTANDIDALMEDRIQAEKKLAELENNFELEAIAIVSGLSMKEITAPWDGKNLKLDG
ncbi:MAG: hypothetical protein LBR53_10945 [Deltaproteobacteria bacterium]|nr:hypothetical protein [Deltaproteobacteria bacterium]